jgi:hypothetical protein
MQRLRTNAIHHTKQVANIRIQKHLHKQRHDLRLWQALPPALLQQSHQIPKANDTATPSRNAASAYQYNKQHQIKAPHKLDKCKATDQNTPAQTAT